MWAIIGGSGFEKFDAFETIETLPRETPFGLASSGIKRVRIKDGSKSYEALFVSRHGEHHESLPTEVNFRANIYTLKKYGAKAIMSFSAVGSLRKEFKPGDCVVPTSYIDRTKGIRAHTYLGDGIVGHVSLAKPVCMEAVEGVKGLAKNYAGFDLHFGQTYVCIEGPYFSTKAEAGYHRMIGADIIGMTHFPEYALAREAGLAYLPCCFITDYDCWDDSIPHVTLEEVIAVMRKNNSKAFKMAQDILGTGDTFYKSSRTWEQGLRTGLMTPKDQIPQSKASWLEVLMAQ
jgi:5'-methylthioadenosine phosphorylase